MYTEIKAAVYDERPAGTRFIVLAPRKSLTDELSKFAVDGRKK